MEIQKGKRVPEFRLATVGGTSKWLGDFLGRPTLYVGWASWDASREMLPSFESLYRKGRASFQLVTIAFDAAGLDPVSRYLMAAKATHTALVDPCLHLSRAWGVKRIPFAVLTDAAGTAVLVDEPGRALLPKVLGALRKKAPSKPAAKSKRRGKVEHPKLEILLQAGTNFLSRNRKDDALKSWGEALKMDASNEILRRQMLALSNPEKFYSGPIDQKWLASALKS
jgi:hypothetical protein